MDTSRWKHGDEFPVLDLVAQFYFKTSASLSFELGKMVDSHSPRVPEMNSGELWDLLLDGGPVFLVLSWLDAHHPCDGCHPFRLRVGLPERYVSSESMRDLVSAVIEALGLPADVPFRVDLAGLSRQVSTEEPQSGVVSYFGQENVVESESDDG